MASSALCIRFGPDGEGMIHLEAPTMSATEIAGFTKQYRDIPCDLLLENLKLTEISPLTGEEPKLGHNPIRAVAILGAAGLPIACVVGGTSYLVYYGMAQLIKHV